MMNIIKYQWYIIYSFYKKLRLIYDQFGDYLFNNYNYSNFLNTLNDLNEYVEDDEYEIIINMYMNIFEFEKEKEVSKRKDVVRNIMLKSKCLCVDVINCIIQFV